MRLRLISKLHHARTVVRFERGLGPRHAKQFRASETAKSASRRRAYLGGRNRQGGEAPLRG